VPETRLELLRAADLSARTQGPVEVVLRPVAEEQKDRASIVGLFADEPELMDEVSDSAMAARERDSLRTRGA
jgi:hypothetical protein